MALFVIFDNHIIVIDTNNYILEIYNITTKKIFSRIGSKKYKFKKNTLFPSTQYNKKSGIYFDDLEKLKEYYNIYDKIDIGQTGLYRSYHHYDKNKQVEEEFFHINYKKNGSYKKYHYDGTLFIETSFIDDKKNGKFLEKTNHYIIQSNYDNGVLHGDYLYSDYSRYTFGKFDNGKLVFANTISRKQYYMIDERIFSFSEHKQVNIDELEYTNKLYIERSKIFIGRNIYVHEYYEDNLNQGQYLSERNEVSIEAGNYSDMYFPSVPSHGVIRDGITYEYFPDGTIRRESDFIDGKRTKYVIYKHFGWNLMEKPEKIEKPEKLEKLEKPEKFF